MVLVYFPHHECNNVSPWRMKAWDLESESESLAPGMASQVLCLQGDRVVGGWGGRGADL